MTLLSLSLHVAPFLILGIIFCTVMNRRWHRIRAARQTGRWELLFHIHTYNNPRSYHR